MADDEASYEYYYSEDEAAGKSKQAASSSDKKKGKARAQAGGSGSGSGAAEGEEKEEEEEVIGSFRDLGVREEIAAVCDEIGWSKPTPIQVQAIPHGIAGSDIIGLAVTGSGKTGAFAIPVLQSLLSSLDDPSTRLQSLHYYALVLTPTRELAFQIAEQFEALGAGIGLKTVTVVGGIDMMTQSIALSKKPHVIVATPGRLVDHLENTKGFSLNNVHFLILDEADRILDMDFVEEVDTILERLPKERNTYLFSATMTKKVSKLQRAALKKPVKVEVSKKYATPVKLIQNYIFCPDKWKNCFLAFVLNELAGNTAMIFVHTCANAHKVALILRHLGFKAVPLHGKMSQPKRLGALSKFKTGARTILVATDVASRGLDIPAVDLVVNYDLPLNSKDYIHRVGRTARAGRAGRAIAIVTQYEVELMQRIEGLLGYKLDEYPVDQAEALRLLERVGEAQRFANEEVNERFRGGGGDDAEGRGTKRKRGGSGGGRGGGSRGRGNRRRGGGGGGRGRKRQKR